MQKTLLTLLISSTLLLSGCNDQSDSELAEKLQQAEQQISQLNAELVKSQQELASLQQTNGQEQTVQKETVPALKVEIYPFFNQKNSIKFTRQEQQKLKRSQGVSREQAELDYFVSLARTGVNWLDDLLVKQILLLYPANRATKDDVNTTAGNELANLKAAIEERYADDLATVKLGDVVGMSRQIETRYIGQRNNIVSFSLFNYRYEGGAHGIMGTKYLNIDVNKQHLLELSDLIAEERQADLKDILWQIYEQRTQAARGEGAEPFTPRTNFPISDNFYFSPDGVVFSYDVYVLGSYAEGEIKLEVPWHVINPLLNAEYRRNNKEGLDPSESD
ncbi:DUF3298 domain-containing protein [Pasteurellaceae bacterium LIM206]|nr:DUF3298 domain-containing protein [Pasteurellaceae bacterium LIM206]